MGCARWPAGRARRPVPRHTCRAICTPAPAAGPQRGEHCDYLTDNPWRGIGWVGRRWPVNWPLDVVRVGLQYGPAPSRGSSKTGDDATGGSAGLHAILLALGHTSTPDRLSRPAACEAAPPSRYVLARYQPIDTVRRTDQAQRSAGRKQLQEPDRRYRSSLRR